MEENKKQNYMTLFEAAKFCSYSEPYLRLRARQGKLKSIKLGKKWMTTAAWLDDYERRIQEWRFAAEAKKTNAARAALVAAPPELAGVVAQIDTPIDRQELKADFCDAGRPLLPPVPGRLAPDGPFAARPADSEVCAKRFAAGRFGGQIFPVPEQKPVDGGFNYEWFAALLSGAVCALLLFMIGSGADIETALFEHSRGANEIVLQNAGNIGAASLASGAKQGGVLPGEYAATANSSGGPAVFENGSLEKLVEWLARFFE